jgi:deferrochelatase/peroxidase EfeB
MDKVDIAQQLIDDLTDRATARALQDKQRGLLFSGYCYYCYERTRSPHIFCDNDCRTDWEREQKMNRIEGR